MLFKKPDLSSCSNIDANTHGAMRHEKLLGQTAFLKLVLYRQPITNENFIKRNRIPVLKIFSKEFASTKHYRPDNGHLVAEHLA